MKNIISVIEDMNFVASDNSVFVSSFINRAYSPMSVILGTGLCTTKEISVGLPFDFLYFLTTAVKVAKLFGCEDIVHFVGDCHVLSNKFVEGKEKEIYEMAQRQMRMFK